MKITGIHKHIDNGGISADVHQDDVKGISIVLKAIYFGYPNVSSTLNLGCQGSDFLKELG